jgi:hypothetical protein
MLFLGNGMVKISENDDVIDICMDNVFKAVFTKDIPESKGALSKLLSAVIGCEVTVIAINANEPLVDPPAGFTLAFTSIRALFSMYKLPLSATGRYGLT